MTDAITLTFLFRSAALLVLLGAAALVWARPWLAGMIEQDARARSARARTWVFVALSGEIANLTRLIEPPDCDPTSAMSRLAGTAFVVAVVLVGLDNLRGRRSAASP